MRMQAKLGLIFFIAIMLLMSWEYQSTNAALVEAEIPEQSIRLRILAHSDNPRDQVLKRRVRDAVVAHMNWWVSDIEDIEEARLEVESRLPDFEQVVGDVLKEYGFDYDYSVEFGMVDFPDKMYGKSFYPAGEYEALLVTIGDGKGRNWWCVLFPPLCFVEVGASDAGAANKPVPLSQDGQPEKEVRFFLFELFEKLIEWLKSLWK